MHATQLYWRPSATWSESHDDKNSNIKGALGRIALLGSYRIWLARNSQDWTGGDLIRATWSPSQLNLYLYLVDLSLCIDEFCLLYVHFRSCTEAWALEIPLETSNCLGLCDVRLEQLTLLGVITLLEVYSAVLCLFFITFENKEMIPLALTKLSSTLGSRSTA